MVGVFQESLVELTIRQQEEILDGLQVDHEVTLDHDQVPEPVRHAFSDLLDDLREQDDVELLYLGHFHDGF